MGSLRRFARPLNGSNPGHGSGAVGLSKLQRMVSGPPLASGKIASSVNAETVCAVRLGQHFSPSSSRKALPRSESARPALLGAPQQVRLQFRGFEKFQHLQRDLRRQMSCDGLRHGQERSVAY